MAPPHLITALLLILPLAAVGGMDILSKSEIQKCESSTTSAPLDCREKLVVNMAVSSAVSGGVDSLVVNVTKVEATGTDAMIIRDPPVITVRKSEVYLVYDLTYIKDVNSKAEERYVETRKCEPDASADIVKDCEALRTEDGTIILYTEPVCCPCGDYRAQTSCGPKVGRMFIGKRNTAHCLRYTGDWFHVFKLKTWSIWFSISVQVKKGSSVSEVVVGPNNRTVVSGDNFLRVNIVGDLSEYSELKTYVDHYLMTPRKENTSDQLQVVENNYSRWLLMNEEFSNDGECNKVGVSYEAFQNQNNFCSRELGDCLKNQISDFIEHDKNRTNHGLQPEYVVGGRFQKINQHPNAGPYSFSYEVTNAPKTNFLVELNAHDIEYVYQWSQGEIIAIYVPTFEAMSKDGFANVTTKNTGKLEASFNLMFNCSGDITQVEGQYFSMKPGETTTRLFTLHTTTDQAKNYTCKAHLMASNYSEINSTGCQFSTTSTVLKNGTQQSFLNPPPPINKDFFEEVKAFFHWIWDSVVAFFTGRSRSTKCATFYHLKCNFKYKCFGPIVILVVLLAAILSVVIQIRHHIGHFDHLGLERHDEAPEAHERTPPPPPPPRPPQARRGTG